MTERRRKTRKKVLKHGDLFHVYIASDTPQEVCEYLSRLKENGDFSYEILQIISNHVRRTQATQSLASDSKTTETMTASTSQAHAPSTAETSASVQELAQGAYGSLEQQADVVEADESETDGGTATGAAPKALDPIQLLRQQRRAWVAGK